MQLFILQTRKNSLNLVMFDNFVWIKFQIMYEMQLIKLDPPVVGDPCKFDDWYKDKEYMWNSERQM